MTFAAVVMYCPPNVEESHHRKIGWRAVSIMCIVLLCARNNNNKKDITKAHGRKEKDQKYNNGKGKTSVKLRWPTFTQKIITYTMRIGKPKEPPAMLWHTLKRIPSMF